MTFFLALLIPVLWGFPTDTTLPTAAVVAFEARGVTEQDAGILTDRFRSELANRNAFRLLERQKMDEVLREQGFQQAGCTSTECAVQTGRLLGVRSILAGSIAHLGNTWSASVREIDVETGEIRRTSVVDLQDDIDEVLTRGMGLLAKKLVGSTAASAPLALPPGESPAKRALPGSKTDSVKIVEATAQLPSGTVPLQVVLVVTPFPAAQSVDGFSLNLGWGRLEQMRGIQGGIVNQVDSVLFGVQGGVVNLTGRQQGVQGGLINASQSNKGVQAGVLNFTGPSKGIQAGLVNVAGESNMPQIGLVNIWKRDGTTRFCPIVGGLY